KDGYTIVMWDVLSADFDLKISKEQCLQNVLNHIQAGSVVVFHDSLKAERNLTYALPKVLEFISEKGWVCEKIQL
ncbi:MAG: polysaccharide deacetylase family protein, partial [Bacteroidota bacterium]